MVPLKVTDQPPETKKSERKTAKKKLFEGGAKPHSHRQQSVTLENSSVTSVDDFPVEETVLQKNRSSQ